MNQIETLQDICSKINSKDYDNLENKIQKDTILKKLKEQYTSLATHIIGDTTSKNNVFFTWLTSPLQLNIVLLYDDHSEFGNSILFISKSETDMIQFHDLRTQTNIPELTIKSDLHTMLKIIFSKKMISNINPEDILDYTLAGHILRDEFYIRNWIRAEYSQVSSSFSKALINDINFNTLRIHSDKYQFEEIVNKINNPQFSFELNECLFAYDNEKWFLCAAGIGAILEHLMYITLENYNELSLLKSKNPSLFHYIDAFKKSKHINFQLRDENYIRSLFQIRNSISHYNDGFTAKDQCDNLLSGIKNIAFNDCIPSLASVKPHLQ